MVTPFPPGITGGTFDQLDQMLQPDVDTVWMELGDRGHFAAGDVVHASEAVHNAISKLHDGQALILSIGGYDQDPRELWNVVEVVAFVRRVMKHSGINHWQHPAVRMFNEGTLALLLQCGVFGSDHPFRVNLVPGSEVSFDRYKRTPR